MGEPQAIGQSGGTTVGGRPSNPEGNWILARRGENPPVPLFRFNASGVDDANNVTDQWDREHPGQYVAVHYDPNQRYGQPPIPGSTLDLQRQRAQQTQQQQTQQTQQRAPEQGQQQGQFTGQWKVLIDGEEVYRFGGAGNSQSDANRIAHEWFMGQVRNGALTVGDGADIEVIPVMS